MTPRTVSEPPMEATPTSVPSERGLQNISLLDEKLYFLMKPFWVADLVKSQFSVKNALFPFIELFEQDLSMEKAASHAIMIFNRNFVSYKHSNIRDLIRGSVSSKHSKIIDLIVVPEENILVALNMEKALQFLDIKTGDLLNPPQRSANSFNVTSYGSPLDKKKIWIPGKIEKLLCKWNPKKVKSMNETFASKVLFPSLKSILLKDGTIISERNSNNVKVLELIDPRKEIKQKLFEGDFASFTVLPDKKILVIGQEDITRFLDIASRKTQKIFKCPDCIEAVHSTIKMSLIALAVSEDGEMMVSKNNFKKLWLWNLKSGDIQQEIKIKNSANFFCRGPMTFLTEGKFLAVADNREGSHIFNTVHIFDLESGKERVSVSVDAPVSVLKFHAPNLLIVADENGTIECWKLLFENEPYEVKPLWATPSPLSRQIVTL